MEEYTSYEEHLWTKLHPLRLDLMVEIGEVRELLNYEDGPRREQLKCQIERIGDAITLERARGVGSNPVVEALLIAAVRFANRERSKNRQEVKRLSKYLKLLKTDLVKLNQSMSALESKFR